MSEVIIFDKATGSVKEVISSAHTPDFVNRDDVLINAHLPENVAKASDCKVVASALVALDSAELTAKVEATKPSPEALKRAEYQALLPELAEAVMGMAEELKNSGAKIGNAMETMLLVRAEIDEKYIVASDELDEDNTSFWTKVLSWFTTP